jgi:hypothetical protein
MGEEIEASKLKHIVLEQASPFRNDVRWTSDDFERQRNTILVEAAARVVQEFANTFLYQATSTRLLSDLKTGRQLLRHWPTCLASALWLQFAEAVALEKRYRVCKECGEWFEIPRRGARINREYWSNACRSKAYRERQERARTLAARGMAPKDIARELDTTVLVVRKWLKAGEGK